MPGASDALQAQRSLEDSVWEDLVVAMLSVGGFSVDKVLELRGSLRRSGLFDRNNLSTWDAARLTRELTAAGYKRGMLTGMYAERLSETMKALAAQGLATRNASVLASGDEQSIASALLPHHGVGPKVVSTFLGLRDMREAESERR